MKSIRIGNDIRIEWPMLLSGDVSQLKELDLSVEVCPSRRVILNEGHADVIDGQLPSPTPQKTILSNCGYMEIVDSGAQRSNSPRPATPMEKAEQLAAVQLPFHVEDNTIIAMWTADRQFAVGDYDIRLYSKKGDGGQGVVDQYRFVRLVAHTAQADAPDDSSEEAVIAMQPVTLEISGLSAYEVAVAEGYTGTREEWLESLKGPANDAAAEIKKDYSETKTKWQTEFNEAQTLRKEQFDNDEQVRNETFKTNEKARQTTFETNEAARQKTFTTNEAERQATFKESEETRSDTFDQSESDREKEYSALKEKTEEAAKTANDAAASITDYQKSTDAKIAALMAGAKVNMTASPSVVYKGVTTKVTLTAAVSGITPDSITILDGTTELATSTTQTAMTTQSVTLTEDKKYTSQAAYNGGAFPASCTVYARYPIYRGFGSSAEEVAVSANMLSARTSAAGTYAGNATADGQRYYILVPSDIGALSDFTMGGAPYVMNAGTATIGNILYKVYESGSVYNTGAEVNITAK